MATPQKIRIAFECKKPDRYQQAYEAMRDIMRNAAIPRNKKLQSIAMMIDAAESGMSRCEKKYEVNTMTLYQFLKEFTLTAYPVTATAEVLANETTSIYIEAPVSQKVPPYKEKLEFPANIVNQDSPLADLEVICVAPYLDRGKDKRTELVVYIKVDKETLESLCRQIDSGTLLGRYWNA